MKKEIFFLLLYFLFLPQVLAASTAENCVVSLSPTGSTRRYAGHQSQSLASGSYTTKNGSANSCVTYKSSNESIVTVSVSGTSFTFTPKNKGTASATASAPASCTCSGIALSKTVYFKLSEWGLSSLSIDGYELNPQFDDTNQSEFSITIPTNIDKITLHFTPQESNATVKVNGNTINKPSDSNYEVNVTMNEITNNNNKVTINTITTIGDSRITTINVNMDATLNKTSSSKSSSSSIKSSSSSTKSSSSSTKSSSSSTKSSSSSTKSSTINQENSSSYIENPESGHSGIYIIILLGILMLGYSFWIKKRSQDNY